jgi:hypothetical protein
MSQNIYGTSPIVQFANQLHHRGAVRFDRFFRCAWNVIINATDWLKVWSPESRSYLVSPAAILKYIREELSSNLVWYTDYPETFLVFLSPPRKMLGQDHKQTMIATCHSFICWWTYHSTLSSRAAGKVVQSVIHKQIPLCENITGKSPYRNHDRESRIHAHGARYEMRALGYAFVIW